MGLFKEIEELVKKYGDVPEEDLDFVVSSCARIAIERFAKLYEQVIRPLSSETKLLLLRTLSRALSDDCLKEAGTHTQNVEILLEGDIEKVIDAMLYEAMLCLFRGYAE